MFKTESNDEMNSLVSKFELGKSLLDEKGTFLGTCVNNLSDFDSNWDGKTKKILLDNGPSEIGKNKHNEMERLNLYGYRKVFTKEFGTTEQVLTTSVDKELSWINVDMKNYTFEKVEKKQKQRRRNRPS